MFSRRRSGFTLIELMLVIAIIAVLMALLLPAVGSVQRTLSINETRTRISVIGAAIEQYAMTYDGAVPPSVRPSGTVWTYPVVKVPYSTVPNTNNPPQYQIKQFDPNDTGPSYSTNYGASFLTFFLMGPDNFGWDKGVHGVAKQWVPPEALPKYLTDFVVLHGYHNDHNFPGSCRGYFGFKDAWGPDGTRSSATGTFQYSVPNPRTGSYNRYDMYQAYYWGGTRDYEGGDNPNGHVDRVFKNIGTQKYVLVSSGPDKKFGFYQIGRAHV